MKCTIDSREQEAINRILNYYNSNKANYPNIESIDVTELSTGDFCTNDNYLGIERKSVVDFISSMQGGRLKQQLYELRQQYQQPLLIVEDYDGIMDCITKNPQLHPNVLRGVVTSAFAHNGVHIQFVNGFYVPFVLELVNKLYDGKKELYENFGYTPIRRTVTKDNFLKYFVYGLPFVKGILGSRLLEHYSSVEEIINSSIEELMQIEGIGKKKAQKIKEVFK